MLTDSQLSIGKSAEERETPHRESKQATEDGERANKPQRRAKTSTQVILHRFFGGEHTNIYIYIYVCIYICTYIYIYISFNVPPARPANTGSPILKIQYIGNPIYWKPHILETPNTGNPIYWNPRIEKWA